jgi:hypothetical protein
MLAAIDEGRSQFMTTMFVLSKKPGFSLSNGYPSSAQKKAPNRNSVELPFSAFSADSVIDKTN